jgi:hypothetical protein
MQRRFELNANDTQLLERLVDTTGVANVLEALAAVCHEKVDHVRSQYDDEKTARLWERAGNKISGFYAKFSK